MTNKIDGINTRIVNLRKKMGISQAELGSLLGMKSKAAVSNWEVGLSVPDHQTLVKLSELGKVTLDWLLTGKESTFERPITEWKDLKGENHKVYPAYFIPVVSRVTAGDAGAILEEANIMYHFPVIEKPGPTALMVEVEGDSMTRERGKSINPGDLVWIDLKDTSVYDGDVVVVTTVDGRQMVKQYRDLDPEKIELRSYNPEYPPIYIRKEDVVNMFRVTRVVPKGWKP